MIFLNREAAGQQLAEKINDFKNQNNLLVLGVSPSGLMVAEKIAAFLRAPLDWLILEKIFAPQNEALIIGMVANLGKPLIKDKLTAKFKVDSKYLKIETALKKEIISKKENQLRAGKPPLNLGGQIVFLVDDGIATGQTMTAAVHLVRQSQPKKILVASPVIAKEALAKIETLADGVFFLHIPEVFISLSEYYQDFAPVQETEISRLLKI